MQTKDSSPTVTLETGAETPAKKRDLKKLAQGCTVVKRGGMIVPFRRERIFVAIEAAFRDTRKIASSEPLPQDVYEVVQEITDLVVEDALTAAQMGSCLTVEGIQDLVEVKLMEVGHHDVARDYIVYRDHHKALRDDSPRNLKVTRQDGSSVRFNPMKIARALEHSFRATGKINGMASEEVVGMVNVLTDKVVGWAVAEAKAGHALNVNRIQDEVERQLMAAGYFDEAKEAILYRTLCAQRQVEERVVEEKPVEAPVSQGRVFKMRLADGSDGKITEEEMRERIAFACNGLEEVSAEDVLELSIQNFYDGIRTDEVDSSNIMAAKTRIEVEPSYSYVAARLLLDKLYRETMGTAASDKELKKRHTIYFKEYLKRAVELDRINPELLDFDHDKLAEAMDLSRDLDIAYLGLQTLYDRYFIHHEDRRMETPQIFWMRVAMGLSLKEGEQKNERAIDFYEVISRLLYVPSTPTLFNAGTLHSQLSSCYLLTISDDLDHIFKTVRDNAQLSKWAGGIGDDWTNVRATGSRIKGTNGRSQGIIPFLKVANDTAVAVNQGGKRKGAMCAYLETWHLDVEDFLELRKNTGDERRRTHDMNTANWIPDLFMKRVTKNEMWTLFSPSDVPDLHDLYGQAFDKRYEEYEKMTETGEIKLFKRVEAVQIWRRMLSMLFETGHPWITFKDPSNIRSPQDHVGVVHSSNLCTEILLNTSEDETAVCNLGSVNLARHTTENGLDEELVKTTVMTAMRMLDNVIDINFYPTAEAKTANLRHRPVGLGLMGFQDALYIQNLSYASHEAVQFADQSMEMLSYYAILGSTELAKERGAYSTFKGSKWDRGILPIDSLELLAQERGEEYVEIDDTTTLDWSVVRNAVEKYGMRNSNTMAIAPTATISNIAGCTQSIEPMYKHLFVKSNLSGEFTITNTFLVARLKELGMWDHDMIDDLKYFDGSLQEIERIPEEIRRTFFTAFEIELEWIIECASRRQKWIDMGQSLNLYLAEPSGKKLDAMYKLAWVKALKTTYYLRSMSATQVEKSTTDINKRGLQPRWMKSESASSRIVVDRGEPKKEAPAMPACSLEEGCESCQ